MIPSDFNRLHGKFTQKEVENTGSNIKDVKLPLMLALLHVRLGTARRIKLLHNGMTTGKHASPEHPGGTAVDFYLDDRDGPITQDTLYMILQMAINIGCRGIGFYYNGKVWSFHLDLRKDLHIWTARKNAPGGGNWVFKRMKIGFPAR